MKKNTAPVCKYCGQTGAGIEFPVFPITPGHKFGEVCVPCDEREYVERTAAAVGDATRADFGL